MILQGEVEQIAMMKPIGQNENDTGMLEFLEDIVGSSRFKVGLLKFRFAEKVTKIWKKISQLFWHYWVNVKTTGGFLKVLWPSQNIFILQYVPLQFCVNSSSMFNLRQIKSEIIIRLFFYKYALMFSQSDVSKIELPLTIIFF